jgi:hypothetical protein
MVAYQDSVASRYALATAGSRDAQVDFLKQLESAAQSLDAVTVEYAPDIDDGDDSARRRAFSSGYLDAFRENTPRLALSRRSRRRRDHDFHDRFVEVEVEFPTGVKRLHELTIGRGLEALFDVRRQCTVTYAPPGIE